MCQEGIVLGSNLDAAVAAEEFTRIGWDQVILPDDLGIKVLLARRPLLAS
jgi:hypothetical protein